MKRFHGIDGLRAWLVWTIVLSHIFLFTAANERFPLLARIDNAAHQAVLIFFIVSGFVITHLLLEKKETYGVFITRRILRIYPVYFLCLCIGTYTTYLHIVAFSSHPFGDYIPEQHLLTNEIVSLHQHGVFPHLLAHLLLLQGAIPNNVMDQSQYLFLGTSWSLSLEWQFYLVAPLILLFLQNFWGRIFVALITVAAYIAFDLGKLGAFEANSFLPSAGLYFGAGITTRLLLPHITRPSFYPIGGVILALGFITITHLFVPFIVWGAFAAWMVMDTPKDRFNKNIKSVFDYAFDSKMAQYFGKLSFATFLVHEPIMHALGYVCIKQLGCDMLETTLVALFISPPLIILASILLHKFLEEPAILYGKKLFREPLEDKTEPYPKMKALQS